MTTIATIKADAASAIASMERVLAGLVELFPVNPNLGKTWVLGSIPGSNWHGSAVEESLQKAFACSSLGAGIAETSDGKTYTTVFASGGEFKGIAAGGGAVLAVGKVGAGARYDAVTGWQAVAMANGRAWHDADFGNGRFGKVAQDGGTGPNIAYSDDLGKTFTEVNSPIEARLQAIKYANGLWVIAAETGLGPRLAYTSDFVTWIVVNVPVYNYKDMDHSAILDLWVLVASGGQVVTFQHPDGPHTLKATLSASLHGVTTVSDTGMIVITGETGPDYITTSIDGETFISEAGAIAGAWQNPVYLPWVQKLSAIGLSGAMYSPEDAAPPLPPGTSITQHATLSNGLLGYWELGADFNDSVSANNLTNNGVLVGGDFIAANSAYLTGTDYSTAIAGGPGSFGLRVNPHTLPSNNTGIIKNYDGTQGPGDFMLSVDTVGELRFYEFGSSRFDTTGTPVMAGVDQYIVVTWDGAGSAIIYYNGAAIPATGGNGLSGSWGAEFAIGRIFNAAGYYFDGFINRVGIWNRELTPAEAVDLSNGGSGVAY